MRMRIDVGLIFGLLIFPSLSIAESTFDYSVSGIVTYSEADEQVKIDGKSASFRAGGAGLRFGAQHDQYGTFYGSFGAGYSPKESASYSGSVLSGPAHGYFYGAGYSYEHDLSLRYKLTFSTDYVAHDITGDLEGEALGLPTVATITSDVSMLDLALALRYSFSRDLHLSFGAGIREWQLDAFADGIIGDSIRATTQVEAGGTDPLYFLSLEFDVMDIPVKASYLRSELSADNSLVVHGLDFKFLLKDL